MSVSWHGGDGDDNRNDNHDDGEEDNDQEQLNRSLLCLCVYRVATLSKCRRCTTEHRSKRKHDELQMKGSIFVQVYM
jgi:hypothetical protein